MFSRASVAVQLWAGVAVAPRLNGGYEGGSAHVLMGTGRETCPEYGAGRARIEYAERMP